MDLSDLEINSSELTGLLSEVGVQSYVESANEILRIYVLVPN